MTKQRTANTGQLLQRADEVIAKSIYYLADARTFFHLVADKHYFYSNAVDRHGRQRAVRASTKAQIKMKPTAKAASLKLK